MKKILIVVDMQNDFIDGALGSKEAVAIVGNAIDKIKTHKGDIIVTYDTHEENYMESMEGRNLPVKHCIRDTEGWNLNSEIQKAVDERNYKAIEKPSFGSTVLPEYIKENYKNEDIEIELIGLCTDICVVSNALMLKAHFPETKISVDENCCAGVTPESHNAAITTMKMCQIEIV